MSDDFWDHPDTFEDLLDSFEWDEFIDQYDNEVELDPDMIEETDDDRR